MIILEINNQTKTRLSRQFLEQIVRRTGRYLKFKGRGKVSLALVSALASQRLNLTYRGFDQPTDVLSFSSGRSGICRNYWGEIIICQSLAKKQAKESGTALQSEIARLLVHGLLHLAGWHHQTPTARRKMEKLTARILKK